MLIRKIILFLLRSIKNKVPKAIKYYPNYSSKKKFIDNTCGFTKKQHQQYQYEKMLSLLKHAQETVPWYKNKFAEFGITYNDFKNIDDIKKFPTVTKEDIRDNMDLFISSKYTKNPKHYSKTGGSTGIPVGYYQPDNIHQTEFAFFNEHWGQYNIRQLIDCSVVFRGSFVGTPENLFSFNPSANEWHFSTYHLNSDNFLKYFKKLTEIRPKFIQAYPSAIERFSKLMIDNGLNYKIEVIMCGSEMLYDHQELIIKKAFNTNIHSWYGLCEKVCLAFATPKSKSYHCFPQYGFTELLDKNENSISKENVTGEIVGTSFYNYAMPLIRYKTKDMANLDLSETEGRYKNFMKLKNIDGRESEFVIARNGKMISMTAIAGSNLPFEDLKQFQFEQDEIGKVVLKVIPKKNFNLSELSTLKSIVAAKFLDDFEVKMKVVNQLPPSRSGKHTFLIQNIKNS
jgi:phenylacetate-CoA ligase